MRNLQNLVDFIVGLCIVNYNFLAIINGDLI